MLDYILPEFVYDYVPYASIFTFELRRDNQCMNNVVFNLENCMNIRIKYNGQFVDLNSQKMYPDSAIIDNPSKNLTSFEVLDLQDKYDMPYAKFVAKMESLLVPGDQVESECSKPYVPNPDPDTLQYFFENKFLQN